MELCGSEWEVEADPILEWGSEFNALRGWRKWKGCVKEMMGLRMMVCTGEWRDDGEERKGGVWVEWECDGRSVESMHGWIVGCNGMQWVMKGVRMVWERELRNGSCIWSMKGDFIHLVKGFVCFDTWEWFSWMVHGFAMQSLLFVIIWMVSMNGVERMKWWREQNHSLWRADTNGFE